MNEGREQSRPFNFMEQHTHLIDRKTHNVPDWMVREIQKIGGLAPDGRPNFRLIWGGDRFTFNNEKELVHAYNPAHWHMERLFRGEYEHVWNFADCLHRTKEKPSWCKSCILDGGSFVDATESFALTEKIIHLLKKSDEMKNKALQKNALMGRETDKLRRQGEQVYDAMEDARPRTVKRSFETPMHVEAPFGKSKMKQIDAPKDEEK